MASLPGQLRQAGTRKITPFWILMKQERMGWQWHQLDHMRITCTSLHTDNHANTLPLNFFTGLMLFLMLEQQSQSTKDMTLDSFL